MLHLSSFILKATSSDESYTLSLHDALPIFTELGRSCVVGAKVPEAMKDELEFCKASRKLTLDLHCLRSEEHTSERQSHVNLVCRLLLENKKCISRVVPDTAVLVATHLQTSM